MGELGCRVIKNMYKGHIDKAKGGSFEGRKWRWER